MNRKIIANEDTVLGYKSLEQMGFSAEEIAEFEREAMRINEETMRDETMRDEEYARAKFYETEFEAVALADAP